MSSSRFHRIAFAAAVVAYLITAWNSTGYHSADEHFQVIAFAQWKLGELPQEHLAWEFAAGIRSSLQPWVAVAVFKAAALVGIHDPFTRAFLLRLLTALLALAAIRRFVRTVMEPYSGPSQKAFILLSYGLWFIPFLSVRFSSEGWSAIFLLHMLTSMLSSERTRHWALQAGLFAGLAMLCRPPTGLIVLSLIAWSLTIRRDPLKNTGIILGASAVVLLCGLLLDGAFYGSFTPATWNYVKLGLVGDPLIQFDQLPWWYYPPWIVKYAIPPIGALILLAFAVLLWKRPSHPIVWCALPYLIVHSFIAHKELRFLYPLAPLVPWMLMEAWKVIAPSLTPVPKIFIHIAALLLTVANGLGLSVVLTEPAGEGRVRIAEELHRIARPGDRIGYAVDLPTAWRITLPAFYHPAGTSEEVVPPHVPFDHPERLDFIVVQDGHPMPIADPDHALKELARTSTAWGTRLMRWYTWDEGQKPWTLYRVEPGTH
ncbi:MAG: hypothetical protein KF797_05855 [Flavobacteriales bacterium]|nr:hypothetical protein [Flavobacteriales bacterium]